MCARKNTTNDAVVHSFFHSIFFLYHSGSLLSPNSKMSVCAWRRKETGTTCLNTRPYRTWIAFFIFLLYLLIQSVCLFVCLKEKLIRTKENTLSWQESTESGKRNGKLHTEVSSVEHQSEHRFDRLKVHLNVSRRVRPSVLCPTESYWPLAIVVDSSDHGRRPKNCVDEQCQMKWPFK